MPKYKFIKPSQPLNDYPSNIVVLHFINPWYYYPIQIINYHFPHLPNNYLEVTILIHKLLLNEI